MMTFLLMIVRFLLGMLPQQNQRLEPVLVRSDGRMCGGSQPSRLPLVWVPGWGWMISSCLGAREAAPGRRTGAQSSGGDRHRTSRPPLVWRDR